MSPQICCDVISKATVDSVGRYTAGGSNKVKPRVGFGSRSLPTSDLVARDWTVRWSNPGGGEIFRTRPQRHRAPPSPLYNGHRFSFQGAKRPGFDVVYPPHLEPRLKKEHSYIFTSLLWLYGLLEGEILFIFTCGKNVLLRCVNCSPLKYVTEHYTSSLNVALKWDEWFFHLGSLLLKFPFFVFNVCCSCTSLCLYAVYCFSVCCFVFFFCVL
jgi:hypothetical protein